MSLEGGFFVSDVLRNCIPEGRGGSGEGQVPPGLVFIPGGGRQRMSVR